jgi:peptidoglycan hydrolase-like protein with peptidoglycan-binding domain
MADTQVVPPASQNYVALPVGTEVGRYRIMGVLGQGMFGVTYRAHDAQLGRDVAIKEYLPTTFAVRHQGLAVLPNSTESANDFAWGRQRFVDEGRTLAGFQRAPGIVRVHDFLEANGTAYIVMELLQGDTLGARLQRKGRLVAAEAERILRALLDGLERVHSASFIHRDIKPDNILLDDEGQPTLIDFGAARAAIAGRTASLTGIFTPGYAAIEQFTDARQGPYTDIYALSATLYQAIAGDKPPSAIDRALEDRCVPLVKLRRAGFAPALLAGIDRGMAVRPEARPQTIAQWRMLLFPPSAPAVGARWRVAALAGLAAVLLAGAGVGAWFVFAPRDAKVADVAAEKRRVEQEAQRKAAAEQLQRQQADSDARRKAAAEEAQRKADEDARASAAARAQADEDARRKAEAERRDAARRLAEQEARERQARDKAIAEEQAHKAAEEAAKAKADAGLERKAAEAAEAALHLGALDRQRIQVALTAQGFDTRGTDGVFGPRSREMVAAWQTARSLLATGFLDAAQQQRLLGESTAALGRFDAEQKKAADEEARRKEQARTDATTALVAPPRRAPEGASAAPPPAAAPAFDGQWTIVRSKCIPSTPQRFFGLTVQGNRFNYTFSFAFRTGGCTVDIRPDGSFANTACEAPVSGRIQGNRMTMSQKHPDIFCDFEFQKQ